jgi:hypothetical protein
MTKKEGNPESKHVCLREREKRRGGIHSIQTDTQEQIIMSGDVWDI